MANGIQKYAANTACCIATNTKKTDKKIQYGAEDAICCINKDFIAGTLLEILMCNGVPSDATWYRKRYTGKFIDTTPTSFAGTITVLQSLSVVSYDTQRSTSIDLSTSSITATSILDFNSQTYEVLQNAYVGDPSFIINPVSLNATTGEMVIDIFYTSAWGNLTDSFTFNFSDFVVSPSLTDDFTLTTEAASVTTDSCLTSDNLCDIRDSLKDYCESC